jgi:signal transduction histidine kinase
VLRSSATPSPPRAPWPLKLAFPSAHTLRHLIELTALTAVYVVAGKLGLRVAIVHPSASAVWAPTGIALAALLWRGPSLWPAIFAGAFIVNITTAGSVATSIGIAAGNTLESLIGARLVSRFARGAAAFERASDTVRFTLLAGVAGTMVSATVGVTSLAAGGFARWDQFGSIWLTWWLGDMSGALVVAPALLLWIRNHRIGWSRRRAVEAAALLAALIFVGAVVFGTRIPAGARSHPLAFLCMPLLAWAAFRFEARVASTAIVALAMVAVYGALRSAGVPERWELNGSLVLLQVFMSVAAFTTLTLAAVVAERRQVESAIRSGAEKLRETVTELEAFSHSISHDLRSPVGAVINYSAVIERDFGDHLGDECIRLLRRIRASAESATGLLDQLLQLGWADGQPGAAGRVDMTSLARDVHGEFLAAGEEVGDIHFEVDDLPPAWGSPALLRCVFRNLLSNAVKFTRGRPERRIRVGAAAGERENVYCVADNGIGIAAQHREAVFLPFHRVAVTRQVEGSGLGLTIAAMIVRRHQGRIWAESDGATGARFCFTLPRAAFSDGA